METLLKILAYTIISLILAAVVTLFAAMFKDERIKDSLKKAWVVATAIVAFGYCACSYAIYYNKPVSKICRNIEDNPKNWVWHLDSTAYKTYLAIRNITSEQFIKMQLSGDQLPDILENKNCGIKIIIYPSLYGGQYEMVNPVSYVFSREEGKKIYEAYSKPIREYNQRLMEPIVLVAKWQEEARQDSIQKVLNNTLNNCK